MCRWSTFSHFYHVLNSNFKHKPLKWQGNSQSMKKRNQGDSRHHENLARIYSLVVPSFPAISASALSLMSWFLWSFDVIAYRHGKVLYRLISWLVLSKLHSNSNSADCNSSAAMLILPWNHVTPNSIDDWFKPFNSRQLVERNRAKFYFRSTTFNNFQHVERQISTFNFTWYTVNICLTQWHPRPWAQTTPSKSRQNGHLSELKDQC